MSIFGVEDERMDEDENGKVFVKPSDLKCVSFHDLR